MSTRELVLNDIEAQLSCLALLLPLAVDTNHLPTSWLRHLLASHLGYSQEGGHNAKDAWSSLFLFFQKANAFSEALLSRIPLKYH